MLEWQCNMLFSELFSMRPVHTLVRPLVRRVVTYSGRPGRHSFCLIGVGN